MKVLAILPARGGSKSIPKKNIADLGGKPMLAYGIAAARACPAVSRIVVDTDDAEIAAVARAHGAETPYVRPAELATDTSPTMPVLRHALEWLKANEGYGPDAVLLLQPTSPFVRTQEIADAIALLAAHPEADSVTSVQEVPNHFHPVNLRRIEEDGCLRFANPEERAKYNTRQSKPVFYAMGNLWLFRPEVIREKQIPIGDRCLPLVISGLSTFDVDGPEDLRTAQALVPVLFPNA